MAQERVCINLYQEAGDRSRVIGQEKVKLLGDVMIAVSITNLGHFAHFRHNWVRTQLCFEGSNDLRASLTNWIRQGDIRRGC